MRITDKYILFKDGVLSNWAYTPYVWRGIKFNTSEHHFMYLKAMHFEDYEAAQKIIKTKTPYEVKVLGRSIRNYDDVDWSTFREQFMTIALTAKFTLDEKSYNTITQLPSKTFAEATKDTIWGIGLYEDDPRAWDESTWKGTNLLGKVLTKIQQELKNDGNTLRLFD